MQYSNQNKIIGLCAPIAPDSNVDISSSARLDYVKMAIVFSNALKLARQNVSRLQRRNLIQANKVEKSNIQSKALSKRGERMILILVIQS